MIRIYVVCGKSGEYEDYRTWMVKAYANRELAERHASMAAHQARRIARLVQEVNSAAYRPDWYERSRRLQSMNKYDPDMELSSTGADYAVFPLVLDQTKGG